MRHNYSMQGYGYRLRPVRLTDALFIIETRREDMVRNRFIHPISNSISDQEKWIEEYYLRDGDYYFVVENRVTGQKEGLIAFYNVKDNRAEWGRWVLKKSSLGALESVYLLYRIAFEQAGLKELYCRTLCDNKAVVSVHKSIGELFRTVLKNDVIINGQTYDTIEQYADKEYFYKEIEPNLEKRIKNIAYHNIKREIGEVEFHHLGIATRGIEKELSTYYLLGYEREGTYFIDEKQGIRGHFLVAKNQPRLELLENLEGSCTLDIPLERGQKIYHIAYLVDNIEKVIEVLKKNRAKIITQIKKSVYFESNICFLMLPNMELVELIEKS